MHRILRIILYVIPFCIPLFTLDIKSGDYLSAVVFVFSVLSGFFLAAATSNYLRLQTLISQEDSLIVSLIRLAKKVNSKRFSAVANKIDAYVVAILDFDLLGYAEKTKKEFYEMIDAIDSLKADTNSGESYLSTLHSEKNKLLQVNGEMILTTKTVVTPLHWFIIIVFAVLTAVLVLELRSENWISIFISGFLVIGILEVLELIYVIDSNKFLADKIAYQAPQVIFQHLGRPNYYPETAIKDGTVKNPPPTYRLGKYLNYPDTLDKKIVTISTTKSKRR